MALKPDTGELELLQQLKEGDKNAFAKLYLSYYAPLCLLAEKHLGNPMDAEDVVSGVFVKLWENRQTFNDPEHIKASLYIRLRNRCLNHLKAAKRSNEREAVFTEEHYIPVSDYLTDVTQTEYIAQLHKALGGLPSQAGTIIRKTFLEGKTNQETAEEMNLSLQTVKNQKTRALGILKNKLGDEEYLGLILLVSLYYL